MAQSTSDKAWSELDPERKAIFETSCMIDPKAAFVIAWAIGYIAHQDKVISEMAEKSGTCPHHGEA